MMLLFSFLQSEKTSIVCELESTGFCDYLYTYFGGLILNVLEDNVIEGNNATSETNRIVCLPISAVLKNLSNFIHTYTHVCVCVCTLTLALYLIFMLSMPCEFYELDHILRLLIYLYSESSTEW